MKIGDDMKNKFLFNKDENKGFSLIELLAVIIIISLILLMVIPSVSRLITNNDNKNYNNYVKIIRAGALRYTDSSEGKDALGPGNSTGCIDVDIADLINSGYIKRFNGEGVTCEGVVRLNKVKGKVNCSINLVCREKGNVTFSKQEFDSKGVCTLTPIITVSTTTTTTGSTTSSSSSSTSTTTTTTTSSVSNTTTTGRTNSTSSTTKTTTKTTTTSTTTKTTTKTTTRTTPTTKTTTKTTITTTPTTNPTTMTTTKTNPTTGFTTTMTSAIILPTAPTTTAASTGGVITMSNVVETVQETATNSLLNMVGVTLGNLLPIPFVGNVFTNSIFWDII